MEKVTKSKNYQNFLDELHAGLFQKAADLAKKYRLSRDYVKTAANKEYLKVMKSGRFDFALKIAEIFNLGKSKIKSTAVLFYKQSIKKNRPWPGRSYYDAAVAAREHKLGDEKVRFAAERAYNYTMRKEYFDEALEIAKEFGLGISMVRNADKHLWKPEKSTRKIR